MPRVDDMFPRKYLQGTDLQGQSYVLTVAGVAEEQMRNPKKRNQFVTKWVVRFQETDKGVILNATRARELEQALGTDDTDEWVGQRAAIYAREEECFGETWAVLHFRAAPAGSPATAPPRDDDGANDSGPLKAFAATITRTMPRAYPDQAAVVQGLKDTGHWPFQARRATRARRALEAQAERQALAAGANGGRGSPVAAILARVRGYVEDANGKWAGQPSEEGQRQAIYRKLARELGLDDAARHRLQLAVFNKESLADFSFAEAAAILRWMSDKHFADEVLAVLSEEAA